MNISQVILRLLAGFGLGVFFYGGLWLTVRQLPVSRHPALLSLGSFWIRSAAVAAGFVFLMNRRWDFGLWLLVAFSIGRFAVSGFLPHERHERRAH